MVPSAFSSIFSTFKSVTVSITVTVVRDRKIRTELRTNQIVGFVPAWKKNNVFYFILSVAITFNN